MLKNLFMMLIVGIFVIVSGKLSFAMMCGGHSQHQQTAQAESGEHKHEEHEAIMETTKEVVDVGNKICPVSNEKIKEGEKYQVEHEGKIYNLCCKMCMKDFKKDPDKYIKKVEEELKQRAEQEKEAMPAPEMPEGMNEGHHHTESH